MLRNLLLLLLCLWNFISYANDDCANAIALTPGIACSNTTGTFSGATITGAAPSCATESSQDVWYKFTATDATNGIYLNAVTGLNHGLEIRQGGCNGTVVGCKNDYFGGNGESYFNNNFIVGQEYYIRVFNATAQLTTASFTICVMKFPTPANDLCANAQQLTPGNITCTLTSGTFSGSLKDGGSPSCAPGASQDVWYKFTATDVTMSVYIDAAQYLNPGFEIYQGGCNGTLVTCKNDYNNDGYSESYFNNNFIVGQQYYVRVFNASGTLTTRTFSICIQSFPTPANDLCANAQQLTPGNITCTLTPGTFSGSLKDGGTPSCAASASQDVWYKFTATDVTMSVYIDAAQYLNPGFEIYQGGCNGTLVTCKNDYNNDGYSESYFNNNFIVGQQYYVRVFNASGTLTTRNFSICIQSFPTPANDLCANAQQLTPGNITCTLTPGTFSGSLKDGGTPSCAASASQDVWYKFTATDVTMSVYIDAAQYLNPGFEIYQGGCNGTLVTCKNDYNNDGYSESYFNNNFIVGQQYYVRVFNASGTLTTRNFSICIQSFPTPANDLCANAQQLTPGNITCTLTPGTFSGSLKDGGTPSCAASASQDVWYKFTATDVTMSVYIDAAQYLNPGFEIYQGGCNGTLVTCKNDYNNDGYSESYFNNNFIVGQQYYVRVFNASGTLTTRNFSICIQSFPTPSNDLCANATQLTPGAACTLTSGTFSGTLKDGGVPSCAQSASQDVWYKFTATDVTMSVYIDAAQYLNPGFEIYQGGCNGTLVTCKNDYNNDGYSESYFNNNFIVGQQYYIRVFNASGTLTTRSFGICVQNFPNQANDLCANAQQLTPAATCTYVTGTFSGTLLDGGAPSCATSASQDVWYRFTATAATMSISLNGAQYLNHGLEIRQGSCTGTVVACKNDLPDGYSESYTGNSFIIGQEYYVRVFNASSVLQTRSFGICLQGPPPAACTPSVAISASTASICQGTSVTFTATPTNGGTTPSYQWKVGTTNVGTNSPTYTTTTLGNGNVVSVVMTSNASCASVATVTSNTITMNVTTPVTPAFTQIAAICPGGSFTLPTTSTNGITGTWSPVANNTATTTYTFTPTAGQCAAIATMTVSVNTNVTPIFTQIPAICTGGSFTLPTTSTNGVTGTWSPAVNNTTITTYTFTPTAGQCAANATMTVSVNSSTTPTFTQIAAICSGGSFTLPTTSNNGITGTWSPAANTSTTTTYTFTPTAGQCASTATMTVSVNSNVTPTFTQVSAICSGVLFTLPTTSNNGITGTWSPAVNNTATTTYTFTPNTGQCAVAATMTVTVNNNVTPTFTQVAAICQGGSFTLPTTSNNGIVGTWSPAINNTATTTYVFMPNAGQCAVFTTMTVTVTPGTTPVFTQVAAICQGGSFSLPTTSTNGVTGTWSPVVNNNATTTYTFTPNAGQCAVTTTMTVTVNNTITPAFTQVAAICPGGSFTLPTVSTNGITGTWSPAVNNNATTTYTFTPTTGQCAVTTTMTVTVNNTITPAFTQVAAICPGGSFTLPTVSTNGITGIWSPAVNNNATTTYTFTPTAGQCATTATMTVTVNNNVTPIFAQVAAICPGGSFTLPTVSTNGVTGTWSPAVNNNATTTYTFTPTAGQCATTAVMTVTVNNNVTPIFTQVAAICPGGSFTLPTVSNNGVTGTWSPAINNNATTTYTFTPNAGQCATAAVMTVTVNNGVIPIFSQVAAICPGGSFTLPTVSNNGVTGTWSPAVNNNATTTYTFTPTAGQCATTATMTVTVNNNVTPIFTQVAAICPGGSFTLPTTSTNGVTGTWSPAVNNNATTTYTFTPNAGQCAVSATMTVEVNAVNASVTASGATITAATVAGATYQWINCATGQLIIGATGVSYTATAIGLYAVIVTRNECTSTSECVAIVNLGAEEFVKKGWRVYPNPVVDQLFIETEEATDIVITDMAGKTIGSQTLKSGVNTIGTGELSAGMYFINSASGAHTKFIKR